MDKISRNTWPGYCPGRLLDTLLDRLDLKRDCHLAEFLGIDRARVSRYRSRKSPIAASVLIRMHEVSGLPTKELRRIMGDRRALYRHGAQGDVYKRVLRKSRADQGTGLVSQNKPAGSPSLSQL